MKKPLMILLSLVLCVMSGACVTHELYSKSIKSSVPHNKPSINEEVSSFLITNDQQQLVIIGKEHHYIFPLYNDLRDVLTWSGRSKIMATQLSFVISKDNKINGFYHLKTRDGATLTIADKAFLDEHDFDLNDNHEYIRPGQLKNGTVYSAGKFKMPAGQSFNQPYSVNISYDYVSARDAAKVYGANTGAVAERVLLTPLAVTADGLIVVGAVVASPFFLLLFSMGNGLNNMH